MSDAPLRLTIVLVGGEMKLEDGSTIDTRQTIEGDPACHAIHSSLAGSLWWWTTTISLVEPLLRMGSGDLFALVIGNRTVTDPRGSGAKRTGLSKFLPGGSTELEITRVMKDAPFPRGFEELWHDNDQEGRVWSRIGVKVKDPSRHWRFLKGNEFYLPRVGATVDPSVLVDTSESTVSGERMYSGRYAQFEKARLFAERMVIVMPHTQRTESLVRGYLRWVTNGRPTPRYPSQPAWDPDAPPDPTRFTRVTPASATFAVTGLVRGGEWVDPGPLEAARQLLEARYDLKIGIWDLVDNDILRNSLLETIPKSVVPSAPVVVPTAATTRAARQVDEVLDERAEERSAMARISAQMGPLDAIGWKASETDRGWFRTFPLTEPVQRWGANRPDALARLEMSIKKRSAAITAFTVMYNLGISVAEYAAERTSLFERLAWPASIAVHEGHPVVWTASGGWGDDVDWTEWVGLLAEKTGLWREAFSELAERCLRVQREQEERCTTQQHGLTVRIPIEVRLENGRIRAPDK
ncbi:MAG: hypothetical protein ACYCTE_13520 [Acidimicrobiales bacterium]